jgi:hypothetical protein
VLHSGFRELVLHMLALDPAERMDIHTALSSFQTLPVPATMSRELSFTPEGCPDGDGTMLLTVRYIDGATTTLLVDTNSTVQGVLGHALQLLVPRGYATLYPSRLLVSPAASLAKRDCAMRCKPCA